MRAVRGDGFHTPTNRAVDGREACLRILRLRPSSSEEESESEVTPLPNESWRSAERTGGCKLAAGAHKDTVRILEGHGVLRNIGLERMGAAGACGGECGTVGGVAREPGGAAGAPAAVGVAGGLAAAKAAAAAAAAAAVWSMVALVRWRREMPISTIILFGKMAARRARRHL